MDAVTLDGLLAEAGPRVHGRHLRRVRSAGAHALLLEVERAVLWLDVGRETAGLYPLDRARADRLRELAEGEPDAGSRQALLHLRKHIDGARLSGLRRVVGDRVVALDAGAATLWLRLARPAVATLEVGGAPLAAFGADPAWPPPDAAPERAWTRLGTDDVAAASRDGRGPGALLARCPDLGASIARRLVRDPSRWDSLRDALASPRPIVAVHAPLASLHDDERAAAELWPCPLDDAHERVTPSGWSEAAATFLELRLRARRFEARRRPLLDAAAARTRRLRQLEQHLAHDLEGLPAEDVLRRQAEALLASGASGATGAESIDLPDPYDAQVSLHVRLDPQLSVPANADRLFEKARRASRARVQVGERLERARREGRDAQAHEDRLRAVRDLSDLPAAEAEEEEGDDKGPRRYLTSRGLLLLAGRGARENHELTFKVARPEDFWLHARDVPGAHVILRDPERRASPEDLREAAEVAAFFSAARASGSVDVHVTRRKHVKPAGGGPGRVRVSHSDTRRVAPRDPEGRLRRR